VRNVAGWWLDRLISTEEYIASLEWLINEGIIIID